MGKIHPTYEEVCAHLEEACARSRFVRRESVGRSFEGRELWLATVTDFDVPDDEKQVAALTCGTHGSEESGRALGMAVIDWARTPAAAGTLRRQKILLFSCVNPDGAARDSYHSAQDVNLYHAYAADGKCAAPEAQAVWDVLVREVPEAYVDCHGLAGGGMHELVLPTLGRMCASENLVAQVIAHDMTRAADAAGFPQQTSHLIECWTPGRRCLQHLLFERFHTIGFTLEMNEGYLSTRETQRSGMARLLALFDYGGRATFGLPYEGYPIWIGGGSMQGIVPHGRSAGERRRNRAEVVPFLPRWNKWSRRPDQDGLCRTDIEILDGDAPAPAALALATRLYPGSTVREVTFDDAPLEPDAFPTGCAVREDGVGPQCVANLGFRLTAGEHRLVIRYDERRPAADVS